MKYQKQIQKSIANHIQLWLFSILFTSAFFPSGVLGQTCPLSGFNCEFSNPDAPNGVIKCGTIVKANIFFPISLDIITITIPSSFEFVSTSSGNLIPGAITALGANANLNIVSGELYQQTFEVNSSIPFSFPIEVSYIYRGCNIYPASPQINTSHLYFDCEGGTFANPTLNCAVISVIGMGTTAGGGIAVASNSTLPPIQVNGSANPTFSGILGNSYDREFTVTINSSSITSFDLVVPIEDDVIATNLELVGCSTLVLSATGTFTIDLSTLIITPILPTSGVRTLTFRQTVTLDCPPTASQNLNAAVVAKVPCNTCYNSFYISPPANLNGSVQTAPPTFNLQPLFTNYLNRSPSTDPTDPCVGFYNYDLAFDVSGPIRKLNSIEIPINTTTYNVQSV
jgi:hypothetical protein